MSSSRYQNTKMYKGTIPILKNKVMLLGKSYNCDCLLITYNLLQRLSLFTCTQIYLVTIGYTSRALIAFQHYFTLFYDGVSYTGRQKAIH